MVGKQFTKSFPIIYLDAKMCNSQLQLKGCVPMSPFTSNSLYNNEVRQLKSGRKDNYREIRQH